VTPSGAVTVTGPYLSQPLAATALLVALSICGNSVIRPLQVSTSNPFPLLIILI
jgi:hypothetical protein